MILFQSTSSIQRKTQLEEFLKTVKDISIHFLYTEEDTDPVLPICNHSHFIPLPLYRGRLYPNAHAYSHLSFQSTSSIQRKTQFLCRQSQVMGISIHFLYTEEDGMMNISIGQHGYFNPLPLYRGRLEGHRTAPVTFDISIHFLYTEEDECDIVLYPEALHFNPLPLYRGRPLQASIQALHFVFQSTSSIQRKTHEGLVTQEIFDISIHFLYTEEDANSGERTRQDVLFQSTSSIQRKTRRPYRQLWRRSYFNPLPLYRGRPWVITDVARRINFNPLPLYRGRQRMMAWKAKDFTFQSTSSIQRKTSIQH